MREDDVIMMTVASGLRLWTFKSSKPNPSVVKHIGKRKKP